MDFHDIDIVYEDNHLLVVVKPAGVPSQADEEGDDDMVTLLKRYREENEGKKGEAYIGLVHRLDRPTGGVMVFAKTSKAAARLSESIRNGDFEKVYLCTVCNPPEPPQGELRNYLKKNERTNNVSVVPMTTAGAKEAILQYKTLETKQGFALLRVKLETGRSHQIRVQLSHIGSPLFGDRRYGGNPATFKHQLGLWATRISFTHPTLEQRMTFLVYPPIVSPWKAFNVPIYLNGFSF